MTHQKSSEAIRQDINATRAQLGNTVDSIQAQLNPERLRQEAQTTIQETLNDSIDSAVEYVRTHRKEMGASVVESIKRNPMPSLLISAGIGWLLVDAMSGSSSADDTQVRTYPPRGYGQNRYPDLRSDMRYGRNRPAEYGPNKGSDTDLERRFQSATDTIQHKAANATDSVQSSAEQAIHGVQAKADEIGSQVRNAAESGAAEAQYKAEEWRRQAGQQVNEYQQQIADQASQIGHTVQEQAAQMGDQAQYYAREAQHQVKQSINDNPLLYGTVALGAGALLAMLLPETRAEDRWMGETSDRVLETARGAARDVADRAQHVVEEVQPEIEQAARKMADEVKQTGQEAVERVQNKTEDTVKTESEKAKEDLKARAEEGKEAVKSSI